MLLLGNLLRGFVSLSSREPRVLLKLMQQQSTMLKNTIHKNWKPSDIAV